MSLKIPYNLSARLATFPVSPSGVNQVTLVLIDGRKINRVHVAPGGEIVKIGDKAINDIWDLDFSIFAIKDVTSEI